MSSFTEVTVISNRQIAQAAIYGGVEEDSLHMFHTNSAHSAAMTND